MRPGCCFGAITARMRRPGRSAPRETTAAGAQGLSWMHRDPALEFSRRRIVDRRVARSCGLRCEQAQDGVKRISAFSAGGVQLAGRMGVHCRAGPGQVGAPSTPSAGRRALGPSRPRRSTVRTRATTSWHRQKNRCRVLLSAFSADPTPRRSERRLGAASGRVPPSMPRDCSPPDRYPCAVPPLRQDRRYRRSPRFAGAVDRLVLFGVQ